MHVVWMYYSLYVCVCVRVLVDGGKYVVNVCLRPRPT